MTYYNCAEFRSRSVFSFGVSRGSKLPPSGTNVSLTLGFKGEMKVSLPLSLVRFI